MRGGASSGWQASRLQRMRRDFRNPRCSLAASQAGVSHDGQQARGPVRTSGATDAVWARAPGPMMDIRSGRSLDTVPPTGQYHPQRCQGGLGARTTAWSCSHAERVGRYGGRRCRLLRATGVIGTRAVPQHGQRRPRFRLSARGEERADAPNREFGSLVQQEVAALSDALERPVAGRDAEGKSRADEVLGSHQLEHRHP